MAAPDITTFPRQTTIPYDGDLIGLDPSTGGNRFSTARIREAIDIMDAMELAMITGNRPPFVAWADLAGLSGSTDWRRAEVSPGDGGTHLDQVTGLTVPNAGVYGWVPEATGWTWLTPVAAVALASPNDFTSADRAASPANVAAQFAEAAGGLKLLGGANMRLSIDGQPVVGAFGVEDDDGRFFSWMAFMRDQSIVSEPMSRFIDDKLGEVRIARVRSKNRVYMEAFYGPDGTLYETKALDKAGKPAGTLASRTPAPFGLPDVLQFLVQSQSLGEGAESFTNAGTVLSTAGSTWGSIMFARGARTWFADDNPTRPAQRAGMGVLVPLRAEGIGGLGETIASGLCDGFKARLTNPFALTDQAAAAPACLFTAAVRGSTRLTAISAEDTGNATHGTSSTTVTLAPGARSLTTQAGLAYQPGDAIRVANAAIDTAFDFSPYLSGTVTSYDAASGALTIDAVAVSTGGSTTWSNWRLLRDDWSAPGGYWPTMLADVTAAKAAAAALGRSHAVGAFIHMQGERNSDLRIYEYGAPVALSAAITSYRTKLTEYAHAAITAICAITDQGSLPWLTYQTLSHPAAQAQLEAAIADPKITMVGPTYTCPRAWNGQSFNGKNWRRGDPIHLSADGERMYGGQLTKVAHQLLIGGARFEPVRPLRAWATGASSFRVQFHVPVPPLVLDTDFLAKAVGYGFGVLAGDVDSAAFAAPLAAALIASATVIGGDIVEFTTSVPLPTGARVWGGVTDVCAIGVTPTVTATGTGPATSVGTPTRTVTVSGDHLAALRPLTDEGAFNAIVVGAGGNACVVRSAALSGGNTVLTYEDVAGQRSGSFSAGQQLFFSRGCVYTNLRDSDPAAALYSFGDPAYPARFGRPYPLWNLCVLFAALPIEGIA